jgi:hypothetical protein
MAKGPISIFVDNSNIWLGAKDVRAEKEGDIPLRLFRIYFKNLFKLVEKGRKASIKELGGSLPPECEDLWDYARKCGYNTNLLHRVSDGIRFREQGVDEALHLKIANTLLDEPESGTLVLLTGDGAQSELNTSFRDQAERALKRGWDVEVWSWKATRSRKYKGLIEKYAGKLSIFDLDDYYESITFVLDGEWHRPDGSKVDVARRVVKALPKQ